MSNIIAVKVQRTELSAALTSLSVCPCEMLWFKNVLLSFMQRLCGGGASAEIMMRL